MGHISKLLHYTTEYKHSLDSNPIAVGYCLFMYIVSQIHCS